jgi:hypothetical protein
MQTLEECILDRLTKCERSALNRGWILFLSHKCFQPFPSPCEHTAAVGSGWAAFKVGVRAFLFSPKTSVDAFATSRLNAFYHGGSDSFNVNDIKAASRQFAVSRGPRATQRTSDCHGVNG